MAAGGHGEVLIERKRNEFGRLLDGFNKRNRANSKGDEPCRCFDSVSIENSILREVRGAVVRTAASKVPQAEMPLLP